MVEGFAGVGGVFNRPGLLFCFAPIDRCIGAGLVDGDGGLRDDAAGVELLIHFNEGDAGFFFTVEEGPFGGHGAAVAGKEGEVEVEGGDGGVLEPGIREDLAVTGGDKKIGTIFLGITNNE